MKNNRLSKTLMLAAAVAVTFPAGLIAGGGDDDERFSLTTEAGRSYHGCKVLKVDPDGLTFSHASGIAKIAFTELSEGMRTKHGYDKEKSDEFIKKHTEVVVRVIPVKPARQQYPNTAVYMPSGGGYYGYGGGYYSDYGYGYGYRNGNRHSRSYPYYHGYPNVPFQVAPERRAGNPIAPSLVSPSNFQQQQNSVQNRAGYPARRVPVVRSRINTPNRPSTIAPRSAPSRLSAPSRIGGKR